MKKIYHLCLSSHDEVLFRSEADLIRLKSRNYEKIHHTRLRERERAGDMSSIRVSSKYRLLFTWANGGANRVKLTAHAHA